MTSLPPETLDALRRAAATREEIVRLVLVEREIEPRSEPAFTDRQLVVVLADPPPEPPPAPFTTEIIGVLHAALRRESGFSFVIPSPIGLEPAVRGGELVYERVGA